MSLDFDVFVVDPKPSPVLDRISFILAVAYRVAKSAAVCAAI
jgi:hypothetical protein